MTTEMLPELAELALAIISLSSLSHGYRPCASGHEELYLTFSLSILSSSPPENNVSNPLFLSFFGFGLCVITRLLEICLNHLNTLLYILSIKLT